jgi:hypothetical protein
MNRLYVLIVFAVLAFDTFAQTLYPATWTDLVNVTVNADNSVTKSGTGTEYVSNAGSENILPAGQNGFIQFTYIPNSGAQFFVSLAGTNKSTLVDNSLYSVLITTTGAISVYERNTLKASFAALISGDIIKLAREGTDIKYYKNTTLLYTTAVGQSLASLRADLTISRGRVPALFCSFDRRLVAKPTFQLPDYTNANGSISLQMEGGDAPFTYQWSSGETTASVSGKQRGTYTVTVTDATNRTFSATYSLGYPVGWKNAAGVLQNSDNTLMRTAAGAAWNAGASSTNILPENTDGWIEFTINDPFGMYMIGLSNFDPNTDYDYLRYAIYITSIGGINVYESNVSVGFFGTVVKGDVFRISREGAQMKYYRNGIVFRTVSITDKPMYLVDVSVFNNSVALPVITTSFDKQIHFRPTPTFPAGTNTGGAIAVNVEGTNGAATVQWSSGETVTNITGKNRGEYTISVTDAAGKSANRSYILGYPVHWNDVRNSVVNENGSMTKTLSSISYNAGGISANRLLANADGAMEAVINQAMVLQQYFFGLSRFNNSAGQDVIDYAFVVNPVGYIYIYERNVQQLRLPFKDGNVLRISREGSAIKYYVDGQVVRTVATDPSYILHVDCSISQGTVPMITASFNYSPQTFYAIADGDWVIPGTWSLTAGGSAATTFPAFGDIVNVNQKQVNITTAVTCKQLNIVAGGTNTAVVISGVGGALTAEEVKIKGDNNTVAQQVLQVKDNANIKVEASGY